MSAIYVGPRSKPSEFYVSMGRLVRTIRRSRGMTTAQLARKVGCAEATIGFWERADRRISSDMILPLAEALRVTPEFLLRDGHGKF